MLHLITIAFEFGSSSALSQKNPSEFSGLKEIRLQVICNTFHGSKSR